MNTRCIVAGCTGTLDVGLDGGVHCRRCERAFGSESLFREIDRLRDLVVRLREALAPLVDGMAHVDPACPEDDTCTCDNVAKVNALFTDKDEP